LSFSTAVTNTQVPFYRNSCLAKKNNYSHFGVFLFMSRDEHKKQIMKNM